MTSEKLSKKGFYPLKDYHIENRGDVKARWNGEKRPPLKGEWYLSGAIIEAYRANNDLTTSYHIAELVKVVETTIKNIKIIRSVKK